MAKSQNHTNHNQGFKLHRNGIKKPKARLHKDTNGMDHKYLRNLHRVRKGHLRALHMKPEEKAAKKTPRLSKVAIKAAKKEAKAAKKAKKQAK